MDLECYDHEEQSNEDRFHACLSRESSSNENVKKNFFNEDIHYASLDMECSNIETSVEKQLSEDTFYSSMNSDTDSSKEEDSTDIFYSALNLETSSEQNPQSSEILERSDSKNSKQTYPTADTFYSSLNLESSDIHSNQFNEILEYPESSKQKETGEDIFYSSLNLESGIAIPQTKGEEGTSLDLECTEEVGVSENEMSSDVPPTSCVSNLGSQHITAVNVAKRLTKKRDTCSQLDAISLQKLLDEHCLKRKTPTPPVHKEIPYYEVVIQKSREDIQFNRKLGLFVKDSPVRSSGKLISLLAPGRHRNSLQNIGNHAGDTTISQSSMKPAVDNHEASLEIHPTVRHPENEWKVGDGSTISNNYTNLVNAETSWTNMDNCDLIPKEMEVESICNSPSGSTGVKCELTRTNNMSNISPTLHDGQPGKNNLLLPQLLLQTKTCSLSKLRNTNPTVPKKNIPSVACQSIPQQEDTTTNHIQCSNNHKSASINSDCLGNQLEVYQTYSRLECDSSDRVYYVNQGTRMCLNVKRYDLHKTSNTVIHSLVCRIFALRLCLKYCSSEDRSSLLTFLEQEQNDAQDLEQLLQKYDTDKSSDFKYSDIKVFDKETVEKEKMYKSRQVLMPRPFEPEGSFINVNHDAALEGGLSLKIESVFSLSNTLTSTIDTGDQTQNSAMKESLVLSPKIKKKRPSRKAREIAKRKRMAAMIPSYVVLERLTDKQMENTLSLEAISRCSSKCRHNTLKLMCHMGLTGCKQSTGKCGLEQHFSVHQDHSYALLENSKKHGKYNNDKACQTVQPCQTKKTRETLKTYLDDKFLIRLNKESETFIPPAKIDDTPPKIECLTDNKLKENITSNPTEKFTSMLTPGVRRVKQADAHQPLITNVIKFTKVDKNDLPQDHVISLHVSSPPCLRNRNHTQDNTEHNESANIFLHDQSSHVADGTTVSVRTKCVGTPLKDKHDAVNSNILTAASVKYVQSVFVSPASSHQSKSTMLNPSTNSSELTDLQSTADRWSESSLITGSVGAKDKRVTPGMMEGIKEKHDRFLVNDLLNLRSAADTLEDSSASSLHKTVTGVVKKLNVPKSSSSVMIPAIVNKRKYVSLLKKQSISTKNESILSPPACQSPASGKTNEGPEIVMSTDDMSSVPPTSSDFKVVPKQRYALCILNDKSYLVPLSNEETISVTESNDILSRLMRHVKGKAYTTASSLLTSSPFCTATRSVPVMACSASPSVVPSTSTSSVRAMSCLSSSTVVQSAHITSAPVTSFSPTTNHVTLSSATGLFPFLTYSSLPSVVPTLATKPFSLLRGPGGTCEKRPIALSDHTDGRSVVYMADAATNENISEMQDVYVKQTRYPSKHKSFKDASQEGLDDSFKKRICKRDNCNQTPNLADSVSLPDGVNIKTEPVNQNVCKLEVDEFGGSPEANIFNEPIDFDSVHGSTSSVQQPTTERENGQWQEIWSSGVLPADETIVSAGDAYDVLENPQSTDAVFSAGTLFEKMYSAFNLIHSRRADNVHDPRHDETEHSPFDMSEQPDNINSRIETTDVKPDLFSMDYFNINSTTEMDKKPNSFTEKQDDINFNINTTDQKPDFFSMAHFNINSSTEVTDKKPNSFPEPQDDVNLNINTIDIKPDLFSLQHENEYSIIQTTDTMPSLFSIQQEKIRRLKELLCQKEKELNKLRNKSRNDSV